MRLTIRRETPDEEIFARDYTFDIIVERDTIIVLVDEYQEWSRQSKRHKPKLKAAYNRIFRRESTYNTPPEIPEDVKQEAMDKVRNSVVFKATL